MFGEHSLRSTMHNATYYSKKAPRALVQALDAKLVPEVDVVHLDEGLGQLKAVLLATLAPGKIRKAPRNQ